MGVDVVRCAWSVVRRVRLEAQLRLEVGEVGRFLSLRTDCRRPLRLHCWLCRQCLRLGPDVDGPPTRKKKPEVGLRVYTKAVDVASGSLSSCVKLAGSAAGFAHGCFSAVVSV